MSRDESATILYLNTIYDVGDRFQIMFIPDLGDQRKKQEVVQKSLSFYEVLQDELGAVYKFFERVRSDTQQRAVSITEIVKETETQLSDIPGTTNIEKLESIGKKIYQSLFPDALKRYLDDNPIETIVLLATSFLIPFELMHNGKEFLATKYDFYRNPILEDSTLVDVSAKSKDQAAQIAIVTNPTGDLEAAERETNQIIDFFKAKKDLDLDIDVYAQKGASYRALSKVFSSPRLDIFHYSGHSGVTGDDIYFHLPDDPFSVIDMYLQYPALFFLNMCESDIRVQKKIEYSGAITLNFPLAIMQRGAKACLATLWPIVDASAAQFAIGFYKEMLKGEPFGSAIRKTKEHLMNTSDPEDITWISFILYGRPGLSTVTIPKKTEEKKVEEKPADEAPEKLTVYFSYARNDKNKFKLKDLAFSLERQLNIGKIYYWDKDFKGSRINYMNEGINEANVVLAFCGPATNQSFNMKDEIRAATTLRKPIIPIYLNKNDVPITIRTLRAIEFDAKNISRMAMKIVTQINTTPGIK